MAEMDLKLPNESNKGGDYSGNNSPRGACVSEEELVKRVHEFLQQEE